MFDAMSDMSYHTVIECEIYGDVVSIVFVPYWELCAGSILASDVVVHYEERSSASTLYTRMCD